MLTHTTAPAKPADVEKKWIVIDANDAVVGRLATFIAMRLRGKHRPDFTPHTDTGDYVVVVNADKVRFTGNKREQKTYYHHTGHPGGIKARTAGQVLDGRFPERVLMKAVERMLPKESPLAPRPAHQAAALQRPLSTPTPPRTRSHRVRRAQRQERADPVVMTDVTTEAPARTGFDALQSLSSNPAGESAARASRRSTSSGAPTPPASARTPSPASGSSRVRQDHDQRPRPGGLLRPRPCCG
jgi:large subunit ribosomal protein L13